MTAESLVPNFHLVSKMISGSGLVLGPSGSALFLQKLGYSYIITFQSQKLFRQCQRWHLQCWYIVTTSGIFYEDFIKTRIIHLPFPLKCETSAIVIISLCALLARCLCCKTKDCGVCFPPRKLPQTQTFCLPLCVLSLFSKGKVLIEPWYRFAPASLSLVDDLTPWKEGWRAWGFMSHIPNVPPEHLSTCWCQQVLGDVAGGRRWLAGHLQPWATWAFCPGKEWDRQGTWVGAENSSGVKLVVLRSVCLWIIKP